MPGQICGRKGVGFMKKHPASFFDRRIGLAFQGTRVRRKGMGYRIEKCIVDSAGNKIFKGEYINVIYHDSEKTEKCRVTKITNKGFHYVGQDKKEIFLPRYDMGTVKIFASVEEDLNERSVETDEGNCCKISAQ